MLRLLILCLAFVSLEAKEVSPSDLRTLSEALSMKLPQIDMGYGLYLDVDELCLSGPEQGYIEPIKRKVFKMGNVEIRPRKKVKGYHYGCVVWTVENSRRKCLQWGEKPYQLKTDFDFLVTHPNNEREWIRYQLPMCKEVE